MISELRVRDLATIADVVLQLGPGLNVLSGETGAGKSLLVDAVALLLGERADSGTVRPGAGKAVVEAVLEVPGAPVRRKIESLGLDVEDDRLIVRREVSAEGRSRAWVNGSPTTIGVLSELGSLLVDLHGQHETQSLLHGDAQRDILDAYSDARPQRAAAAEAWATLTRLADEERTLVQRRDEVRRRADYLRHVVAEIDRAALQQGEDARLDIEAHRLGHAGTLVENAARMVEALEGEDAGAMRALAEAGRALTALERIDPTAAPWREMLDAAYANVSELARAATEYAASVHQDPVRLAEVERRRDLLFRLSQKYGATIDAVLATRNTAAAELDLLDTADLDLRALAARRTAADGAWRAAAGALSARRKEGSARLARAVNRQLPQLGLASGRLDVELPALDQPAATGQESVRFMVRLNAGMEPRPLARSASGGELSRLMLALKVVLAGHDAVPTLIFDEVDQGVGGETGTRIAEALAGVAERHQVLVITHLPQIAARADRHLVVSKAARGGIATSDVHQIHGEDRVAELARMLGDPDAETARRHAQALLRR